MAATIDGAQASFADVTAQAATADAVIIMAGTISEEGEHEPQNSARPQGQCRRGDGPATGRTARSGHIGKLVSGAGRREYLADLLFGVKNPSGKLPVTFPYVGKGFLDNVSPEQFPGLYDEASKKQTVRYAERLNIGYRWYDANVSGKCNLVKGRNPCVAFPFGHGLSYTSFAVTNMAVIYDPVAKLYRAKDIVTNTGKTAGAEVVQAYLALPSSANAAGAPQPPKRLVGFLRVELRPGERKQVEILIDPEASNHPFSVWREAEHKWAVPEGQFALWLGTSSSPTDLTLAGRFSHPR